MEDTHWQKTKLALEKAVGSLEFQILANSVKDLELRFQPVEQFKFMTDMTINAISAKVEHSLDQNSANTQKINLLLQKLMQLEKSVAGGQEHPGDTSLRTQIEILNKTTEISPEKATTTSAVRLDPSLFANFNRSIEALKEELDGNRKSQDLKYQELQLVLAKKASQQALQQLEGKVYADVSAPV